MESSPPSDPKPPWLDTPTCKLDRAGLPCGGPLTAADHGLTDGWLICCACGRKSESTAEEEGQAARADEAWEREQNRSEIRHWLTTSGQTEVEAITCAAMAIDMEGWTHGEIRDAVAVVLAAAGWKVGESALTAEAKLRDLAMLGTPIRLPPRIKAITFKFTVGASTQSIHEANAALEADNILRRPGLSEAQDKVICQECGAPGAACSYKCGAILCEAHGAEHQPPDCPPQMDEYLRDTARAGGEP